jgi:hypothetical protein
MKIYRGRYMKLSHWRKTIWIPIQDAFELHKSQKKQTFLVRAEAGTACCPVALHLCCPVQFQILELKVKVSEFTRLSTSASNYIDICDGFSSQLWNFVVIKENMIHGRMSSAVGTRLSGGRMTTSGGSNRALMMITQTAVPLVPSHYMTNQNLRCGNDQNNATKNSMMCQPTG